MALPFLLVGSSCSSKSGDAYGTGGEAAGVVGGDSSISSGGVLEGGAGGTDSFVGGAQNVGGENFGAGGPAIGGNQNHGGVVGAGGEDWGSGGTGKGGMIGVGGKESTGGADGGGGNPSSAMGGGLSGCDDADTLGDAGACTDRLIGVALAADHLNDDKYVDLALEFTYATAENEMKWGNNEPTPGGFNFAAGDQIVDFALARGMKIKGHALVWHSQLASWVEALNTPAAVRQAMVGHINGVMDHYRGKVEAWDVVNEAWQEDGSALRNSVFFRELGAGFIDEAFLAARAADPTVKLFYNEFDAEDLGAKSNQVYEMVKSMVERGIPIDGVGLQMHVRIPDSEPSISDLTANIERLTALGLEVHLSELDVRLCLGETIHEQSQRLHDVAEVCLQNPLCTAMSIWGITDKYSWLNDPGAPGCPSGENPYPLLWDGNYQKKPIYDGFLNALLGR